MINFFLKTTVRPSTPSLRALLSRSLECSREHNFFFRGYRPLSSPLCQALQVGHNSTFSSSSQLNSKRQVLLAVGISTMPKEKSKSGGGGGGGESRGGGGGGSGRGGGSDGGGGGGRGGGSSKSRPHDSAKESSQRNEHKYSEKNSGVNKDHGGGDLLELHNEKGGGCEAKYEKRNSEKSGNGEAASAQHENRYQSPSESEFSYQKQKSLNDSKVGRPFKTDPESSLPKSFSEGPRYTRSDITTFEEDWRELSNLTIERKRQLYTCGRYKTLSDIDTWAKYAYDNGYDLSKCKPSTRDMIELQADLYQFDPALNEKVSLFIGDITSLEIDCIVNAANTSLLGGGGVDGAIHRAAGPSLLKQCKTLHGCRVGDAKITYGYKLPSKFVVHTVGPMFGDPSELFSAYERSMLVALEKGVRSIAFPCIATGIYGFPNDEAVKIVLPLMRRILTEHMDRLDRVIFCLFMNQDITLYKKYLQIFFPVKTESVLTAAAGAAATAAAPLVDLSSALVDPPTAPTAGRTAAPPAGQGSLNPEDESS